MNIHKIIFSQRKHNVLFIAFYAAIIVGVSLFYSEDHAVLQDSNVEKPAAPPTINTLNYQMIASYHLFGQSNLTPVKKLSNANFKLVGIIFDEDNSKAIINIEGKEKEFRKGDIIQGNYTIEKIGFTEVYLKSQNGTEVAKLFDSFSEGKSLKQTRNNSTNED